jgi:leucyl-tRNA synthetase
MKYNHTSIERKWQKLWEKKKLYAAKDGGKNPKWYSLFEFPYPSGDGLHVGHLRPYIAMDVISRKRRMEGFNVLFPIGWDAFGLPTENYAIKTGIAPDVATKKNTDNFRRQIKAIGTSLDWNREINTTDPAYYQWTQWMFLKFFEHGLAYKAEVPINWCPKDKTGLANEEVVGGACERCGTPVEKRMKKQWMIRITSYAEKLLEGLNDVDFLPEIKQQQINWIGRSEGAEIDFEIKTKEKPNFVLLHGFTATPKDDFHPWLKRELESRGYHVTAPELPNTENPTIPEQIEYVLKNIKFDSNTVLLGHSLGAVVAMKVVEQLKQPIRKLVLAGGFMKPKFKDHSRPFEVGFDWRFDVLKIKNNAKEIRILHALNDSAVPRERAYELQDAFGAHVLFFEAEGDHICGDREPILLRNTLDVATVFTTRPDTIFGATYMVLAPEHASVLENRANIENWSEVLAYVEKVKSESEEERLGDSKEKTGIELKGLKAINPATKEEIPVWVADYVLASYGTGAVMAVPAHDERDFAFAKKYHLSIREVVSGGTSDAAYIGTGKLLNSGKFTGKDSEGAKWEITEFVGGKKTIKYKLRDWVFSRQRYWGEPIPLIHCETCGWVPVPEKDLPVKLPKLKDYKPREDGESPLASVEKWVNTKCPKCKKPAKRETDTMPNWAGSSWYFLRYVDPKNKKQFASDKKLKQWLPVDWYNGGMEHTVLHLLYSRFWNRFLCDIGLVPVPEPYKKRTAHGLILAEGGVKMSKSKGNVVNPDALVKEFGADALRLYEMFMGPFNQAIAWDTHGILGTARFLERVWNIAENKIVKGGDNRELEALLHKTIKKVSHDVESMAFNTAVSSLMIFVNACQQQEKIPAPLWKDFLLLLAPFAPHIAEELWPRVGGKKSIHIAPWPSFKKDLINDETYELVIQVNGKFREKITVPAGIAQAEAERLALENLEVKKWVTGSPKKVIFVSGRMINFVV